MTYLRKYMKKYWKPFGAAVAILMLETICDLLQPTIMAKIVDIGVKERNVDYVLAMGLVMLGVTAIGAGAAVCRNYVSSVVSQNFGCELRSDLFKKVQSFSFDNIDSFETASLVTRLTNDVTQVQNFAHGLMRIFVKAPLLCIGGLIMATLLNPKMALVLVVIVPVIVLLILLNMKVGFPFFKRMQTALDRVNGVMREYLAGVRVVKAFNRFGYETNRFKASNDELAAVATKAMRVMAVFTPSITLLVNLGIISVLWFGGIRVSNGNMQVGQVIAFINYMTQILFSLMMISFVFTMLIRARASAERIGEVFAEEPTMPLASSTRDMGTMRGKVDYENVTFSYKGMSGDPVLKNISFSCRPGETIGIIGSTGAGKTSLVSMLPRFYDVSSGGVKIDGIDVREMDLNQLRDRIAVVPQKSVLFTGTILDNLRWGKEHASLEEVEKAAKAACAHDFIIGFPEGYQTMLGQGGVTLSGGQKQRISIARALVKSPAILILDDSTSAVDVATEAKIREALKEYYESMTCFLIAQRITSVMGTDKILVLEDGEIAGIGSHSELLDASEVYRDIFHSQIGKEGA